MNETQVTLSQEQYELAKLEADRMGLSLSDFIGRLVSMLLTEYQEKPWMRYAGLIESGEANSSQTIDRYIYE